MTIKKKDVERRKIAKMLCFEAHQNQSLERGLPKGLSRSRSQDSMLIAALEHYEKKSYSI